MTNTEATAVLKQIRNAAKKTGADCSVARIGSGKHQTVALWGADSCEIVARLERSGFVRTAMSGAGTRLSPITIEVVR